MAKAINHQLPPSEAKAWEKLKPLVIKGKPLDYAKVAETTGWKRSTVSCRLSRLRRRYHLPIPMQPTDPDRAQRTSEKCPSCEATLEVWQGIRWCPGCGWDEERDGRQGEGRELCSSMTT